MDLKKPENKTNANQTKELEKQHSYFQTGQMDNTPGAPAKKETENPKNDSFSQRFKNWLEKNWLARYRKIMRLNNLNAPVGNWLAFAIFGSIILAIAGYFLFQFIGLDNPEFLSIILLLCGLDLGIGYPYFLEMNRIDEIEKALPEALKQIADTLQAGGTYEFALRELQNSDLGPLNDEIEKVLRKLDEGENMENSLRTLSEENDSKLIKRSVTIIIDALKTGAGLSEVLDQIADDIRAFRHLARERKSRTIMGVLLMVAAGAMVAPGLFGINTSILDFMIKTVIKTNIGTAEAVKTALTTQAFIGFVLVFYIFVELIATSIMISLMRDGKPAKTIIYAPLILLVGYMAYYGTRLIVGLTILRGT